MADLRNFVPFMSGAKNRHKSPFMLARGETYGLPWIQAMNVHNAFFLLTLLPELLPKLIELCEFLLLSCINLNPFIFFDEE